MDTHNPLIDSIKVAWSSRKLLICLLLLALIALTLRLAGIASRPIWYDEAFSLLISQKGPAAILQATLGNSQPSSLLQTTYADIHPPAYYFLLWGWTKLFGVSVVGARVLSLIISLFTLVIVFLLTRSLFDDLTACVAVLLAAILPFQVHYAVEMRMYALLALFLTLATFAFWKAVKTGRIKWWIVFAVAAALGEYTHNLAAFYLVPLALTSLFLKNKKIVMNTLLAGLGALLLYLPWLVYLPGQFSRVAQSYWIERPTLATLFNLVLAYVTNLPLPTSLKVAGLFISAGCIGLAAYQTYKAVKEKTSQYKIGLWLLYLSFVPALLLWLFSQWRPVYLERALLPAHVLFCVWIAWVLIKTPAPRPIRIFLSASLLIGCSFGLFEHYAYQGLPYAPYQALDESLTQRIRPGDIILHSNKLSYLPALYYDGALPQLYINDMPGSKTDTLAEPTSAVLGLRSAPDVRTASAGESSIWFVIFQEEIDETAAGNTGDANLQYLLDHYQLTAKEAWGSLWLYHFQAQGTP